MTDEPPELDMERAQRAHRDVMLRAVRGDIEGTRLALGELIDYGGIGGIVAACVGWAELAVHAGFVEKKRDKCVCGSDDHESALGMHCFRDGRRVNPEELSEGSRACAEAIRIVVAVANDDRRAGADVMIAYLRSDNESDVSLAADIMLALVSLTAQAVVRASAIELAAMLRGDDGAEEG